MARAIRTLTSPVGYLVLLVMGSVICMSGSFLLVRGLTERGRAVPPSREAALAEAEALRTYSNELMRLTADFVGEAKAVPAEKDERLQRWLETSFMGPLTQLRTAMLRSGIESDAMHVLSGAAARAAGMASAPRDPEARRRAVEAVLEAATRAEQRIADLGVSRSLSEPALFWAIPLSSEP